MLAVRPSWGALLIAACGPRLEQDTVCLSVAEGAACPSVADADVIFTRGTTCSSGEPRERVAEVTAFDERYTVYECPGGKGMCADDFVPYDKCCYLAQVEVLDDAPNCGTVEVARIRSARFASR